MKLNKENALEEYKSFKNIDSKIFAENLAIEIIKMFLQWLAEDIECPKCKGTGKIPISFPPECIKCQGEGTIPNLMRFVE